MPNTPLPKQIPGVPPRVVNPTYLSTQLDPAKRIVVLQYRGPLDLNETHVLLPVGYLKLIIGKIVEAEGQSEMQAQQGVNVG